MLHLDAVMTAIAEQGYTLTPADRTLLERAFVFARDAHEGQLRKSGVPYFEHAFATGLLLAQWGMTPTMVSTGFLHDVAEDTPRTIEDIRHAFGSEIASIAEGEMKLSKLHYHGNERFAENLRKMFVAMAKDVRVIGVKFADRVDNLRSLSVLPKHKQHRIALETIEIYAPIANRLGMMEIKQQLEDLAFPYANPDGATWVESLIATTYDAKRNVCSILKREIEHALTVQHVQIIEVQGRMKQRYSLYLKLLKHGRDITTIYDLIALRIIVESVADCYTVLGFIHQRWKPLRGRIKDYIANPKSNGYQSIHTTVTTDSDDVVEFQIRTAAMHEEAEWGAAAAWRYHEPGTRATSAKQLRWVNELIEWQRSIKDPQDFIAGLKTEVLRDRILIFTPRGDVIDLPEGATPLDFAYAIHSELGNHTVGARVNGKTALHPLDKPIFNGDMVEILVDQKRKGPSQDWLHVVRTTHARSKIKEALRAEQRVIVGAYAQRA